MSFACSNNGCWANAHVYGGRCDDCFEAYLSQRLEDLSTELREEHKPAFSREHRCSGGFDFYRGCYVCDESDHPHCPSHRLAQALREEPDKMNREGILIEIKNCETMLTSEREEEEHAATRLSLEQLRRQLARMCEKCGEQRSVVLTCGITVCRDCVSIPLLSIGRN